jgi:hypothetical protein
MVGTYLHGRTRFALAELANKEGRSVSSTVKLLVSEGLLNRGMLCSRAGNDPRQP